MARALTAVALGGAALLLSGCGGSGDDGAAQEHGGRHAQNAAVADTEASGKPATMKQIADALGCEADIITEAEELKQGGCETKKGQFAVVTFATDKGKHDWLKESKAYGGTYLVGQKWSVTGPSKAALAPLREKLGGRIETGADHTQSGGGEHGGHKQ